MKKYIRISIACAALGAALGTTLLFLPMAHRMRAPNHLLSLAPSMYKVRLSQARMKPTRLVPIPEILDDVAKYESGVDTTELQHITDIALEPNPALTEFKRLRADISG